MSPAMPYAIALLLLGIIGLMLAVARLMDLREGRKE